MATLLDELRRAGLDLFELPDWEARMPIRQLWVTQGLVDHIDSTATFHDPALAIGGRTLFEHAALAFCDFRCTERPASGDIALRRLIPTGNGIWSLHAPGLRIYGWCPCEHGMALVDIALEKATKDDRTLNDQKRKAVESFVRSHGLGHTVKRGDYLDIFPYKTS